MVKVFPFTDRCNCAILMKHNLLIPRLETLVLLYISYVCMYVYVLIQKQNTCVLKYIICVLKYITML